MTWEQDLEQLLRNQMPYAFMSCCVNGGEMRPELLEPEFQEALGYILENVRIQMKKAFFEGYASGGEDTLEDCPNSGLIHDRSLSRVGAERAYNKWEER